MGRSFTGIKNRNAFTDAYKIICLTSLLLWMNVYCQNFFPDFVNHYYTLSVKKSSNYLFSFHKSCTFAYKYSLQKIECVNQ